MPNRLATQQSPYLLQHAHNPVDWYPWGEEAFEKARTEDKPIFLSVGYSTCHWCHVMERESFEDPGVAEVLNRYFVPVKVDREERPDVDRVYMTFVQATTGGGGWPMSVFLTPRLEPFFGGTYFPPDNRYGRPGFRSLLEHLARAWTEDRSRIDESGSNVVSQLRGYLDARGPVTPLDAALIESAYASFRRSYDSVNGGFGQAPKFPRPSVLNLIFRYWARSHDAEALEMGLETLRAMANGGINDHLAGGFHRYSVDERWFVPHFEKMLYDQAQLAVSYLEAFQISADPFFAAQTRAILDYVLSDMTAPEGAFYSAEDADSVIDAAEPGAKGEGAFYVWKRDEIEAVLDPTAAGIVCLRYGVRKDGNVREDPHGEFHGRNILAVDKNVPEIARVFSMSEEQVEAAIEQSRAKLAAARASRVRPQRDDKILTSWNALMISAFARAAQALGEETYAEAAVRASDFLIRRMYDGSSGVLLRRFRDDDAAIPGFLDDYAFLIQALIDLYETRFRMGDLDVAIALADRMIAVFEDTEQGAFFSTPADAPHLILRIKEEYDGAEPSGNSIAILALLRLAELTNRESYRESANRALGALCAKSAGQPTAVPQLCVALDFALHPRRQVIIAGDEAAEGVDGLIRTCHRRFLPDTILIRVASDEERARWSRWIPAISDMRPTGGRALAYVCRNYTCQLPVDDEEKLAALLQ